MEDATESNTVAVVLAIVHAALTALRTVQTTVARVRWALIVTVSQRARGCQSLAQKGPFLVYLGRVIPERVCNAPTVTFATKILVPRSRCHALLVISARFILSKNAQYQQTPARFRVQPGPQEIAAACPR